MTGKSAFYIVDVFAPVKYSGNQLAVVTDGDVFTDSEMQKIAREMNFSETTFLLPGRKENTFNVRIFTPFREVAFAGHPVLGTAFVIQHELLEIPLEMITLNVPAGKIPVSFLDDEREGPVVWMKQNAPQFGRIFDPGSIAPVIGLTTTEIDGRFPIQEVSTGLPFIIIPLKSLDSVKRARINFKVYEDFIDKTEAKALFIFSPETYEKATDLNARMFADYYGVPEDPATGSANGCLAAYLVKHLYFNSNRINCRVEQGYEIMRPSLLMIKASDKGGEIEVFVGGGVKMVAKGELL